MRLPGLTVGIVADDLTGACDTSLQFFRPNNPEAGCVRVLLETVALPLSESDPVAVWAINTESRHLEKRHATAAVREAAVVLKNHYGVENLYKKMDSTLRGHFTEEILAAIDSLHLDAAIIAPAYPQEDRRTVGGYQLIRGIPVEQTDVARDPLFPVHQSHLPTLIKNNTDAETVGHIELGTVLRGAAPLLTELTHQIEAGKKLIVVDACSNTDLDQIALACEKIQKQYKVLPCGSAGLASALSRLWCAKPDDEEAPCPEIKLPSLPILMVIGSNTTLSRTQLHQLKENYPFFDEDGELALVELKPEHIVGTQPLESVIEAVSKALFAGKTTVLASALKNDSYSRTIEMAQTHSMSELVAARRTQDALATVVKQALAQQPARLMMTGGETVTHVCQALGWHHLDLVTEVAPSIPLLCHSSLQGSAKSRLQNASWLVTKSGNFGGEVALANIVRYLKQHEAASVSS